jgi:hypothetical protein
MLKLDMDVFEKTMADPRKVAAVTKRMKDVREANLKKIMAKRARLEKEEKKIEKEKKEEKEKEQRRMNARKANAELRKRAAEAEKKKSPDRRPAVLVKEFSKKAKAKAAAKKKAAPKKAAPKKAAPKKAAPAKRKRCPNGKRQEVIKTGKCLLKK